MGGKLTGDWGKLFNKLDDISSGEIAVKMSDQLESSAEELASAMKGYIKNQEGNWLPLDPDTVRQKGNSTILMETGSMVDSISVKSVGEDKYLISAEGSDNQQKLRYHEYGTSKMSARPVVRPVYQREKQKVKDEARKTFKEALKD